MTNADQKFLFFKELSHLYSATEIEELYFIFSEYYLGLNKMQTRANAKRDLSPSDSEKFAKAISELKDAKPYQQILGEAQFFGHRFFVNEHVLIPRPETEELLELAIKEIKKSVLESQNLKILDIGTGSGIIPIVLKKHFPEAKISALDVSPQALDIAKKNADYHGTEIHFLQTDYLESELDTVYDIIISNPPYIAIEENKDIEHSVKGYEPNLALFSPTSDALIFYRKIAADAEKNLSENGMIFLEINQKLGQETLALFDKRSETELLKDISGNDRMIFVKK